MVIVLQNRTIVDGLCSLFSFMHLFWHTCCVTSLGTRFQRHFQGRVAPQIRRSSDVLIVNPSKKLSGFWTRKLDDVVGSVTFEMTLERTRSASPAFRNFSSSIDQSYIERIVEAWKTAQILYSAKDRLYLRLCVKLTWEQIMILEFWPQKRALLRAVISKFAFAQRCLQARVARNNCSRPILAEFWTIIACCTWPRKAVD